MSDGPQTTAELKAVHDLVLASKPQLPHQPCALCDKELETMTTYTEDELNAAVTAAVQAAKDELSASQQSQLDALQAELDSLREANAGNEVERAVAEATVQLKAELGEANSQVEAAQAEVATVTAERDALQALIDEETDKALVAARRDERLAAVKDLAVFPDKFVDESIEKWAEFDDEAWTDKLDELTKMKDAVGDPAGSVPSRRSALTATSTRTPASETPSASKRLIRRSRELLNTPPSGN